ncbi:MAG: 2-hydroxyacid dehydrogenase [Steroidobacteraceae bacterium]|nr:2-hydroxyacid dehydrogenase [Steroidobacteraceae bacterium]
MPKPEPGPLVVLLYSPRFVPPDALAYVSAQVPEGFRWLALEQSAPPARRAEVFAEADYMFGYLGDPSPAELAAARRLKLFQLLSAGYDWLDLDAFRRHGIPLANNDGSNAVSTAEHAVLLMLALLRQLPRHHAATAAGEWLAMQHAMQLRELRGKVVGLVGFGQIARQVARRVHGFDALVRYAKPRPATPEEEQPSGARHRSLDELLAESDIVSLHAPLGPQTRGLIDARALARMRPGSWLVNTARGALVDEAALHDALAGGHLAGAGLDVFAHEPIDPDSPLLRLPNVVLTPHVAGSTRDTWDHRMVAAWANVRRVAAGQAPLSRIA